MIDIARKSHFIPFAVFLPPKELKMEDMTSKTLQCCLNSVPPEVSM